MVLSVFVNLLTFFRRNTVSLGDATSLLINPINLHSYIFVYYYDYFYFLYFLCVLIANCYRLQIAVGTKIT
jgi:hypothetical protein